MSIRDDFAAFVEDIGAEIGVPVKCRKMRRPAYEWDGEWFPEIDEYEVREPFRESGTRRVWTFDAMLADMEREAAREVIESELESR